MALSVMVIAPVRVPVCVGVNATLNLQLAPAAKVAPQVFKVMAKSPFALTLVMFSVAVPVFDIVTALAAEVFPTAILANVKEVGDKVTTGWPPACVIVS